MTELFFRLWGKTPAFKSLFASFGSYVLFAGEALKRIVSPRVDSRLVMVQMESVGVQSIGIILMAAIMIGAVFGIQFGKIFRVFGAESMIGAAASFALSKELAPVIGAFLVTGRSGAAMAAEIANMKVNEQIDAMRIMAVHPIAYLVSPRVLASMLMLPLLYGFFVVTGILSAYVIGVMLFDIDVGIFFEKIRWISEPRHIFEGIKKSVIFGLIFSTVGCYKGFHAGNGAKGVGEATTAAVVISLVAILISDFFLSYLEVR